jgi:predicted acyl esterase
MAMLRGYSLFAVMVSSILMVLAGAVHGAENRARPNDPFVFEKNISIPTDDGAFVMANVFRPKEEGKYPVLVFMSVYGKDLATKDLYTKEWEEMKAHNPGLCQQSSCRYHTWETADPELWVPNGYVLVRVDSRGAGKSPGKLDIFSPRETRDLYDVIEWAGKQPWSNGKVGMTGISYYAINQWLVASLQPPHLAAIAPWEGAADFYRDISRHGGIYSNLFPLIWFKKQVLPLQHGNGQCPFRDLDDNSSLITGSQSLTMEQLEANRADFIGAVLSRPLDDDFYRGRSADFSKITVPLISGANWGGFGLHSRGNFEGYYQSASKQKWLEVHGGNHRDAYYEPETQALFKEFFDHFLKGENNGWEKRPPVMLAIRHVDGSLTERTENEWPLERTVWKNLYLDAGNEGLSLSAVSSESKASYDYEALKNSARFVSAPFDQETEITGPVTANLWVSSSTADMDIFATVQLFSPDGTEVTFEGASEPAVPISQGWLRVSHRKRDPLLSKDWRPYHTHDSKDALVPGETYEVQVELWPTCIVVPKGYRIALRVEGKDFTRSEKGGPLTGSGPFLHFNPKDRPPDVFGGENSIHTGGQYKSYLQIPVVPPKK